MCGPTGGRLKAGHESAGVSTSLMNFTVGSMGGREGKSRIQGGGRPSRTHLGVCHERLESFEPFSHLHCFASGFLPVQYWDMG